VAKNGGINQNKQKNVVLFSHLDFDGRSGERDVFVIFLLLASSDARFSLLWWSCSGHSSSAAKLLASCIGIDIQKLRTCSDKCHKSSVIFIKMENSSFEKVFSSIM